MIIRICSGKKHNIDLFLLMARDTYMSAFRNKITISTFELTHFRYYMDYTVDGIQYRGKVANNNTFIHISPPALYFITGGMIKLMIEQGVVL